MRDAIAFGVALIGGCVLAVVLLFAVVIWLMNALSLPGSLVKIEQLRSDAAFIDPQQGEDVIGQVTMWNQTIVSNQTYNDIPIIGLLIPDEWDSVEVIAVPK